MQSAVGLLPQSEGSSPKHQATSFSGPAFYARVHGSPRCLSHQASGLRPSAPPTPPLPKPPLLSFFGLTLLPKDLLHKRQQRGTAPADGPVNWEGGQRGAGRREATASPHLTEGTDERTEERMNGQTDERMGRRHVDGCLMFHVSLGANASPSTLDNCDVAVQGHHLDSWTLHDLL